MVVKMKKYLTFFLVLIFLILVIPAFSLLKRPQEIPPETPSLPKPAASSLPEEALENNRFYLVQDHQTGETLRLTPEEYIRGVVAAEMPVSFHTEALKAQAVAAHTYALRQISASLQNPSSDLNGAYLSTDPAHFQSYFSVEEMKSRWGDQFAVNYQKICEAVDPVIGQILTYEKEPIISAFHSISGGITESAQTVWGQEVSYLVPADSPGDELSPHYETQTVLTAAEVRHALASAYPDIALPESPAEWLSIQEHSSSGTVTLLTAGNQTLTGTELRSLLNLRSAQFQIRYDDGNFTFTTFGYGHGVGMSQYGADYLARQGYSYDEILRHYYTGAELTILPE